jgi:oligosaccharide repeat unit polymerase
MREVFPGKAAPIAGLVSAVAGTLVAIMFVPDTPSAQGALTLPALALATGILFVPAVQALTRSKAMMNAENFVAFAYVYWILLDPIQGAYNLYDASDEAITYTFIAIGISAAAMWAGVLNGAWRLPQFFLDVVARPLEHRTIVRIFSVCFALGMFNYLYSVNFDPVAMFSFLGENRWSAPWAREQFGGWDAFLDHAQYFGYVLPSLAALLVVRRGWLRLETWLAIGAAVIMVLFLAQGGGRRIIGVTIGAAILVWALAQPKLNLRRISIVVVAVSGVLWLMQFMLESRMAGYQNYAEQGSKLEYLHVDDNFLRLAQIIDIVPEEHPYLHLDQITYVLVRPIPRVFWEGKPKGPGFDLAETLGLKEISLSSSIIGEWYLSLGWLTVLLGGWLHGRLASTANVLLKGRVVANNPIVYALAVMVLVAGIRSMVDLVIMSYAILAWYGVLWIVTRRSQRRSPSRR